MIFTKWQNGNFDDCETWDVLTDKKHRNPNHFAGLICKDEKEIYFVKSFDKKR